jgi:hypothetical protein
MMVKNSTNINITTNHISPKTIEQNVQQQKNVVTQNVLCFSDISQSRSEIVFANIEIMKFLKQAVSLIPRNLTEKDWDFVILVRRGDIIISVKHFFSCIDISGCIKWALFWWPRYNEISEASCQPHSQKSNGERLGLCYV